MTKQFFGTDGIRGKVGETLINPEFVLKLGWAVGKVLATNQKQRGRVLIGKDTRVSGYMLESCLEAGLSAAGVDIRLLGPMPTPAIAYLTRTFRADAGIVISASHNPHDDNGIKFFSSDGDKLPDDMELAIEHQLQQKLKTVDSAQLGKASRIMDAPGRYIEFCKSTVPPSVRLDGMKIVVDCANGATYHIAPSVYRELGAEVIAIAVRPDGFNINKQCGSTHPEELQKMVLAEQADVGIALDGDGDRLIMVDHQGEVLDGDELLYIMAQDSLRQGQKIGGVVGTVMSNLGLEQKLQDLGLDFVRTDVGDRHILRELKARGWLLGGEPSGHIAHLGLTTTGDGIVSSLQVLAALHHAGKNLHELKSDMPRYPQVKVNVRLGKNINAKQILKNPELQGLIQQVTHDFSGKGRILVRASGTEPVIRIMVEGSQEALVREAAERLELVVSERSRNQS